MLFIAAVIVMVISDTSKGIGGGVEAARILGIFPTPSVSHQVAGQGLMKALARRGHQVTVISTDPLKEPMENYTNVDLSFSYTLKDKNMQFIDWSKVSGVKFLKETMTVMANIIDQQLQSPQMKHFIQMNVNKTFDLAILHWHTFYSYLGLIHALGSPPVVGVLTLGGTEWTLRDIGNYNHPAVNPDPSIGLSNKMTFWQRMLSVFNDLLLKALIEWNIKPQHEALIRKHFGAAPPSLVEAANNMSLLVLNNHWTTEYARPLLPNVVEVVGIHVEEETQPIPKDLQQWMDGNETSDGIVYFSLGSNILSKNLPKSQLSVFLRAFSRLSQRVLWKFELDDLPGLPSNVRLAKWLPQQAVLAHPNVRLFVTQGGLQSLQEAVYHAVPMLAIPFIFDQYYNAEMIATSGIGRRLRHDDLHEEKLYSEMIEILQDHRYKENIKQMSTVFREHKSSTVENVLWWIEYVLRHNGAPHLRSEALHLPWHHYILLEGAIFVLYVSSIFLFTFFCLWRIFSVQHSNPTASNALNTNIVNK